MNKRYIKIPLLALILTGCSMTKEPGQAQLNTDKPSVLSEEEQMRRRNEVRENLYEHQFELIKDGKPPMPLLMTPELKKKLEDEGIPIPDQFKE